MDTQIVSIAETFISKPVEKTTYLKNFWYLLNGFDSDSQKKLLLLIKVLNIISIIRFFKPIHKLSLVKRDGLLHAIHNSQVNKLKGGITGLRSLCLLAFYSMDENRELLGLQARLL